MTETAIDYKSLSEEYAFQITVLKQEIAALKKLIFGSKSESFIPQNIPSAQLSLDIHPQSVATCSVVKTQKIEYTRNQVEIKRDHPGRTQLPEHLERRQIIIEPLEKTEGCKKIGEEITEELEYEPGKLFVNRYVRPKYVMDDNTSIIIAPVMDRPLPKAIVGPGLLAQIIIDKYVDHLPLYRQKERFQREGINIAYSTIGDWIKNGCALLDPLGEALKKIITGSDYLHADETPLKVLDKNKKGTTHRGFYWVYHNSIDNLVWFDYRQGRGRKAPMKS